MLWAFLFVACMGLGETSPTDNLKTLSTVIGDTADTSGIFTTTDPQTTPTGPQDSAFTGDELSPALSEATPQCQTTSIEEELVLTALDLGIKAVHTGIEASSCATFVVTYRVVDFEVFLQVDQDTTTPSCADCYWTLDTEFSVSEPGTYTVHSLGLTEEVVVL